MKLVNLSCPNCGAKMNVDKANGECFCDSCGGRFLLDDESTTHHIDTDDAHEAGYQFELGRQKAQAEAQKQTRGNANVQRPVVRTRSYSGSRKKNNLIWWILGFLIIFPVPVSILIYRSKRMSKKTKLIAITAVWAFVLIIGLVSTFTNGGAGKGKFSSLTLSETSDIEMNVGDEPVSGYVQITARNNTTFTPDDVVFISEDPEIATIAYSDCVSSYYLYFHITPVSEGETYVYASAADGSATSERIHVIVHADTGAE